GLIERGRREERGAAARREKGRRRLAALGVIRQDRYRNALLFERIDCRYPEAIALWSHARWRALACFLRIPGDARWPFRIPTDELSRATVHAAVHSDAQIETDACLTNLVGGDAEDIR